MMLGASKRCQPCWALWLT